MTDPETNEPSEQEEAQAFARALFNPEPTTFAGLANTQENA